jgi:hypothetical protein
MSITVENPSIQIGENSIINVTGYNIINNVTPSDTVVDIVQSGNNYIITVNPTTSTLYYINGKDSLNNPINLSGTVYVNVSSISEITINYDESNILNAYGSKTYLWYPDKYLNITTSDSVICTPLENITYTILGTDIFGVQSTANVTVKVNTFIIFTPSNPKIYDGNLLNISVIYNNPNFNGDTKLIYYDWISSLFTGLPPQCIDSTENNNITLNPYNSISYTVNAYYYNSIISSDVINIEVIEKPSNIIDIDIIPFKLKDAVFKRDKKELIYLIIKYKNLSKKIIDFYYTTLQTAYRMEFTTKTGISFKVQWLTLYQIKNKSNGLILNFTQQWKFFQYVNNTINNSNFKYLLNTINEIYFGKPEKILIVPLGST